MVDLFSLALFYLPGLLVDVLVVHIRPDRLDLLCDPVVLPEKERVQAGETRVLRDSDVAAEQRSLVVLGHDLAAADEGGFELAVGEGPEVGGGGVVGAVDVGGVHEGGDGVELEDKNIILLSIIGGK